MLKTGLWTLLGGLVVWFGAQTARAVLNPVMTAFAATGAQARGFSVNAWVELPASPGSLSTVAHRLAQAAHLAGPLHTGRGPTWTRLWVRRQHGRFTSEAIVERLAGGQTYLVLDRAGSQGFSDLSATLTQFRTVLAQFNPQVHLAFTLEGSRPGLLDSRRAQALVGRSLQAVSARPVNGLSRPRLVSVAGYTPFLPESERLDGRALNLQVATAWNSAAHRTDVYVGTPLITVPY